MARKFVVAEFSFHCWLFDNLDATSRTTLEICTEPLNQAIQIIKGWFKKGIVETIIYDSTKDKQGDRFSRVMDFYGKTLGCYRKPAFSITFAAFCFKQSISIAKYQLQEALRY